ETRSAEADVTMVVNPRLAIASTSLEPARAGQHYRARIRTLGGVGPMTFTVRAGRLPIGVRLEVRSGLLTGKPRRPGTHRVAIEVRDRLGAIARRTLVLAVR